MHDSILSTEDIHLLNALERHKTLSNLSVFFRRDKSVISRKLKTLSLKTSSIEKIGNQWRLTETGKRLSQLGSEFELEQKQILNLPTKLTIAGTRLFVSSFLSERMGELKKLFPNKTFTFISYEGSAEQLLLDGKCDIAFSCSKPKDPSIAFRRTLKEPYYPVCTTSFAKKNKIRSFKDLQAFPHLALINTLGNLSFSLFLKDETPVFAKLNDPMGILKAVEADLGWSVLPYYAIQKQIQSKKIQLFKDNIGEVESYGIWWLRTRKENGRIAEEALLWLGKQSLQD